MSTPQRKQINVPGICAHACLKKLRFLLAKSFTVQETSSIPSHMVFKARLERIGLPREMHLEVYANSNVDIKASPEVRSFNVICNEIEFALKEAINILSGQDTIRVKRSERIIEYMRKISVKNEVERMIIVILCDIILDLLVTEKLSHFTHKRQDLENESVGAKLDILEKQFKMPVYESRKIRDIRDLRNRVAHGGDSPVENETIFAKNATVDIFETL